MSRTKAQRKVRRTTRIEICILAGGLSTRMGRDKARVRIGGRTMLSLIRETAQATGLRVRVIRRDIVPRCGPLGGIITAFHRSRADALLFLACDMPLVTPSLLERLVHANQAGRKAVFASAVQRDGFPFLLSRTVLPVVEEQRARKDFSLQTLSRHLKATKLRASTRATFNVNTPEDLRRAMI